MTAPRRILNDLSVHEGIKSGLRALRSDLPAYDVERGAARFEAMLAASARASSPAAAKVTKTLAAKGLLVVGALVLLGSATYALRSPARGDAASPPSRGEVPAEASPGRGPESPDESSAPVMTSTGVSVDSLPSAPPTASAPPTKERATAASDEREREVRHLASLQQTATADAEKAVQVAKEGHAQFPRGALFQERELILIDALVRAGRHREARDHARTFLAAYPKSPSAAHVREVLDQASASLDRTGSAE
ncbi:MAG: hypothetical protein KF782_00995 [Labilithrix sp.]|nr:hypothetical protein [Labilithrix sp.]